MYSLTKSPNTITINTGFFNVKQMLSDDDIEHLNNFIESIKFKKAGVGDNYNLYESVRNTSVFWMHPKSGGEVTKIIFEKICLKIIEINESIFQYELTDIEPIQYSRYHIGDFYKPHIDNGNELFIGNTCRKLSFSIQLNDPSEYNGGDLLAYTGGTPTAASKEKGSMTLFPSFTLHEVTPVTRGIRNALVGWCWGPKFK